MIKTRDTVKDIWTLDRTVNVAGRMKGAYICTKEQAEQAQRTNFDSTADYAEDRVIQSTQVVTREASSVLRHHGKRFVKKTWHTIRGRQTHVRAGGQTGGGTGFEGKRATPGVQRIERGIKRSVRTSEQAVKKGVRGKIKTAERGVKTAEQTTRASINTAQTTAKAAAKTAQATAKLTQRAAQATRAAARTAATAVKAIAKAGAAVIKSLIAAVKGLIAVIAAGGWVAVVIIVVVLLAAAILGSVFGIFASDKGYNGAPSMPEVISQINSDFSDQINAIIDANPHNRVVIDNAGSASMVASWSEVLAIYSVLVATDPENPIEVATLDDEKISKLKAVFWSMNIINYSLSEVDIGTVEETGESVKETVLTIMVSYKTAEDMITYFGFTAKRAAQVRDLLQPEYDELFMRLTGSYQDITLSVKEISEIMNTLPANLSEERKNVVLTAYSLLGRVYYFWGGKSLVLGWDSRWGMPMRVWADGSPSTGTVRPFGLDCSGFVDWVFYNVAGGEYIIGHGGGATAQFSYCEAIAWIDAQPGDLAFYPGCAHAGIVVKNEAGTLTIIHCASGYNNVFMTKHTEGNGFAFVGRPQIYGE